MVNGAVSDCNLDCHIIQQLATIITVLLLTQKESSIASLPYIPAKLASRKTINLQEFFKRFYDQSLIRSSFQIATNSFEDVFFHKLWVEHISCSTVDSKVMSGHVCLVSSKIQEHSNHTAVAEITRGRLSLYMFGKRLPFAICGLSICRSNIEVKSFQHLFDQTFL